MVGAVLAVAGFAVADAVRSDSPEAPETTSTAPAEPAAPLPPTASFPRVPAPGELLFADASDCRLRSVPLRSGRERRLPTIETGCELRVPPTGPAFAYGLDAAYRRLVAFRFSDLGEPGRRIASILAFRGDVQWSADGRRAAWCRSARAGFVATTAKIRVVEHCPVAMAPGGEVAWASGGRLMTRDGPVLATSGRIYAATWGRDGSIGLLVDGRRLERWSGRRRTGSILLPRRLAEAPRFSPDNCAALLEGGGWVHVLDLGCFRGGRDISLEGDGPAAWSPDGEWVVVGRPRIAFYRVPNIAAQTTWDAVAGAIAWRD